MIASAMAAKSSTGRLLASIKSIMEPPFDPTLVDSPPKLLDVLNKSSERLPKMLNKRDERGYTLLHVAVERNQPESLKCLLIKDGTLQFVRTSSQTRPGLGQGNSVSP